MAGMATASSAATASTTAPTRCAATRPFTNCCPLRYPPWLANTELSTATPSTVPSWRRALDEPDATPSRWRGAKPSVIRAAGAKNRPMPSPARTNGGTSRPYPTVGAETALSQAIPAACSASAMATTRRPPIRSDSRPDNGAATTGIAVHGSVRSPAANGEYPCTVCRNWALRKTVPNIPNAITSDTALMRLKPRSANSVSGTIGARARACHATKATSSAPPPIRPARTGPLVQPCESPRTRPNTTPNSPALTSRTPGGSSRPAPPRLSLTSATTGSTRMPIGTLIQKIHCHDAYSVIPPPITGPSATPSPLIPPHSPKASPRRSGATTLASSVSVSGMTTAPPSPCTARAATSAPTLGASAAAADATVKTDMPTAKTRRRPNRSPSAAPGSRKTANIRVYALTVHSSPSRPVPRLTRMTGSALVTTRLSMDTMNTAMPETT
jgi:hypothetical protein